MHFILRTIRKAAHSHPCNNFLSTSTYHRGNTKPLVRQPVRTLVTPVVEAMSLFVPHLFIGEEHISLGRASSLPMEQKRICSGSEEFIPEATLRFGGLSAIMSKEWIEQ